MHQQRQGRQGDQLPAGLPWLPGVSGWPGQEPKRLQGGEAAFAPSLQQPQQQQQQQQKQQQQQQQRRRRRRRRRRRQQQQQQQKQQRQWQ